MLVSIVYVNYVTCPESELLLLLHQGTIMLIIPNYIAVQKGGNLASKHSIYILFSASKPGTFEAVGPQLMVCQLVAMLEILHASFGLVKSSPAMIVMQVIWTPPPLAPA